MKQSTTNSKKRIGAGFSVLALLTLAGCETINPVLSTGIGTGIGAIIGNEVGGRKGAAIGGTVGGVFGYAFAKSYNASSAQRSLAEQRGRTYSSRSSSSRRLEKERVRYVAVPVKSTKGNKKDVVLYDTKTKTTGTKAYEAPAAKSYSSGEIVSVGGQKAMVSNSFQGI